jgi:hypothetical protein
VGRRLRPVALFSIKGGLKPFDPSLSSLTQLRAESNQTRKIEFSLTGCPSLGRGRRFRPAPPLPLPWHKQKASRVPYPGARGRRRAGSSLQGIGAQGLAASGRAANCGARATRVPRGVARDVAGRRSDKCPVPRIDTAAENKGPMGWYAARRRKKRPGPPTRNADRPTRRGASRSAARDEGPGGISPGAGPKPGPRSDRDSTAKHSPEWPTQKPLGPASWLPLPRRAGSAGFPQTRHAAELG